MWILAIDTSGPLAFVALRSSDGRIFSRSASAAQSHNEELPRMVLELLVEAGINASDLERLVIGRGPGSFTGLRIGYSFMKGLAVGLRLPIQEYSSLEAYAFEFRDHKGDILTLSDARRDEFFVGVWSVTEQRLHPVIVESIMDRTRVEALLRPAADRAIAVVTGYVGQETVAEVKIQRPCQVAESLLAIDGCAGIGTAEYAGKSVSQQGPHYLRAVAAKSIEERRQACLLRS